MNGGMAERSSWLRWVIRRRGGEMEWNERIEKSGVWSGMFRFVCASVRLCIFRYRSLFHLLSLRRSLNPYSFSACSLRRSLAQSVRSEARSERTRSEATSGKLLDAPAVLRSSCTHLCHAPHARVHQLPLCVQLYCGYACDPRSFGYFGDVVCDYLGSRNESEATR